MIPWEAQVLERGKCCICSGTLKGSHVNLCNLNKKATWNYPVWGNLLAKDPETWGNRATAILCDNCVDDRTGKVKGEIKLALEIRGSHGFYEFIYHKVEALEDAETITEQDLRYPFDL